MSTCSPELKNDWYKYMKNTHKYINNASKLICSADSSGKLVLCAQN